jgi:hypothetical protein
MGAHQDLSASRAGDPADEDETGQGLFGHTCCLGDGAGVAFDQLQLAQCVVTTALKDPGCEALPLAPGLCQYGDLGPDRLADRHLAAEDAGDEQAKPRLLLSDIPAVFDFLGFGLWQQGGKPVPDDGIVDHLADATADADTRRTHAETAAGTRRPSPQQRGFGRKGQLPCQTRAAGKGLVRLGQGLRRSFFVHSTGSARTDLVVSCRQTPGTAHPVLPSREMPHATFHRHRLRPRSGAAGLIAATAGTAQASACPTANLPLPDSSCTPGAYNPDVTQSTIHSTICVSGWTATARPPYTNPLKAQGIIDSAHTSTSTKKAAWACSRRIFK